MVGLALRSMLDAMMYDVGEWYFLKMAYWKANYVAIRHSWDGV